MVDQRRRRLLQAGLLGSVFGVPGCTSEAAAPGRVATNSYFRMPAEEAPHAATWMCFPGRGDVWGRGLPDVQAAIADIALAIAEFEPVRMLIDPADRALAVDLVGSDIELLHAPVDDLWARDTLPLFLVSDSGELAAGRVRFNGWGGKQVHDGDETLAEMVADILAIEVHDTGIVGEGGGLETDGAGTLLAARSSWVNNNRNPGRSEDDIANALIAVLGAERMLWVDGVAGQDITDGHIDTLARFAHPGLVIHELRSYVEPGETWYDVAVNTAEELNAFRTLDDLPYELATLRQPATPRGTGAEFLSSYVNYYVCNGGLIMSEFGDDRADRAAQDALEALYPDREFVALNTDAVAAGGGGIHCATQQQPAL